MRLFIAQVRYTKYVRRSTFGGMDSEFSHTEVDEKTLRIIAPDEDFARLYIERSHRNDKEFKIIRIEEEAVHAIVSINHRI